MTIEELRPIVSDLQKKAVSVTGAASDLRALLDEIWTMIDPENPLSTSVNVDNLITTYSPIYIDKLTKIEQAADVFGTDILN